jgi:glycosyltransferase involved in cell wall biosynthesis
MKICYVFSASQSVYHFMEGQLDFIDSKGVAITIAIPDDEMFEDVVNKYPFASVVKTPIIRKINMIQDLYTLFFFIKFFMQHKFSIIHLHTPKAGLLGGLSSRLCFCKNIIFHLHGLVSVKGGVLESGITNKMEKFSMTLAHKVISVSPSMAKFCIDNRLVHPDKISVLCNGSINGIDCENRFNYLNTVSGALSLRNDLGLKDKFIIGFLGRVNEDKGLNDIVLVFKFLLAKYPNVHLCLVGESELELNLNSFLNSKIGRSYTVVDKVTNPQDYLSMFDLLLYPSKREGLGLALAEAAALKTPSVAYNIFGVSDVVQDKVTGQLVPYNDVQALTKAVENYIDNPVLLSNHGDNARNYIVQNFKREDIWCAQYKLYQDLCRDSL